MRLFVMIAAVLCSFSMAHAASDQGPTLRALFASSGVNFSNEELSAVAAIAKAHHVDLDRPMNVAITNGKFMIEGRELSYDAKTNRMNYGGVFFKNDERPLDIRFNEIYTKLSRNVGLMQALFLPSAHADEDSTFFVSHPSKGAVEANHVAGAGLIALIAGTIVKKSATDEMLKVGAKWLVRAGVGALIGGIIVEVMWPSPAGADDMDYVTKAYCDKKGIRGEMHHGGHFEITQNNGKISASVFVAGQTAPNKSLSENLSTKVTADLQETLKDCAYAPRGGNKELANWMNDIVNKSYGLRSPHSTLAVDTPTRASDSEKSSSENNGTGAAGTR